MFQVQGIFTDDEINTAMQNTNLIADMCESWEIDYSKKYPQLYNNPEEVFKKKIAEGIKYRGIDKLPLEKRKQYAKRIQHEYEVYKANSSINYMLLEDDVKTYARSKGLRYGFGRGSVSGSIIAYLMRITEMNSIERNLNFDRFMSKERISLADIDTDFQPSQRHIIQDYLLNHPTLSCAHIITYNTIADKGAIRDVGRGLGMSLNEVDEIAKNFEENEQFYRDKYPELFYYVDLIKGTVTSVGSHACGIAVSPIRLDEYMGTMTVIDNETKQPVLLTQINMKEIDAQNFVKLDLLALDTVELLSQTVDFAGIKWEDILPDNIDINDEKVWKSIVDSNVGIFQYESDFGWQVYKDLFSEETIAKIREKNPNFSYMDLFSLGNAIIRPAGASYRDDVMQGNFYDNGHEALNKFLAPTLGRMVYQEQIIQFLVEFCGYSGGEADVIRRAIGKKNKETIDKLLPEIKSRFVNTMINKYGTEEREATRISEPFMQVILDASNYGFSINHSDAYSFLGYACAWLRYYYPLEFITASLNVNIGKEDKTNKLVEYAKSRGIQIKPIKFRYSKSGYMFDKETNSIYQGVEPIKFLNAQVADGLYKLRDRKYNSFVDLLLDIKDGTQTVEIAKLIENKVVIPFEDEDGETQVSVITDYEASFDNTITMSYKEFLTNEFSKDEMKQLTKLEKNGGIRFNGEQVPINSRQMNILISLNFFSEFGDNKKLMKIYEAFDKTYKPTHKLKTKKERYAKLLKLESEIENEKLSLVEQCEDELEYLGHIVTVSKTMPANMMMVTELQKNKTYNRVKAYQFSTGETREFKIGSGAYAQVPFNERDVIQIIDAKVKPKNKRINGKWQPSSTEKEVWLKEVKFLRKGGDK